MRYDPSFLDEIRARIPVSDVVGRHVTIKKRGREYVGLSPFKTEKTPSFTVNDQKAFYHCFATGEHGDIFKFLMKTQGLSFPEAVTQLAEQAGVAMPVQSAAEQDREDTRKGLRELMQAAQGYFRDALAGEQGGTARRYLDDRRIPADVQDTFGLGFAPDARHGLKTHLAKLGFTEADAITSGMLIGGEDIEVSYDRFRHRVMFPITDLRSDVIAFGGRALNPDVPAKYLNSPETPLFHKGQVLYNAAAARKAAYERSEVVVVEGYMDVIAMARAGVPNAVAPLGTALTEGQLGLLWRMAEEPVLCFDGDVAGRKAAHRAAETALPGLAPGKSLRFAFMPDGQDPDDLLNAEGASAVRAVLKDAQPLADTLWHKEWQAGDWSTPERRAQLEANLRGVVQRIADPAVHAQYEREFAERLTHAWGGRSGGNRGANSRKPWSPGRASGRENYDGSRQFYHSGRGAGRPRSPGNAPGNQQGNRQGAWDSSFRQPASTHLLQHPMLQNRTTTPSNRERLLIRVLLNHPRLIADHADEIAELHFNSRALAAARDTLLAVLANHEAEQELDETVPATGPAQTTSPTLDTAALARHLERLGEGGIFDAAQGPDRQPGDRFAEPDAPFRDAEAGWCHLMALHRPEQLKTALRQAEEACFEDGSDEAFATLMDVRGQVLGATSGLAKLDEPS